MCLSEEVKSIVFSAVSSFEAWQLLKSAHHMPELHVHLYRKIINMTPVI